MDPQEPHSSSSSSRPLLLNNLLDNTSICDICIRTIIEFECIINTVFDYCHKWGPLDCPQYKRSLEFLFEQKRPRMAYRYLLITSHGNREVCSSKFREVYDITEKQLDTCQKVVGGVFWKARRANWYRTCDLRSSNLDVFTCQSIDPEEDSKKVVRMNRESTEKSNVEPEP